MLVFLTMQRYGKDRMPPKTFNERPVFLGKPFYDSTPGTVLSTLFCANRSVSAIKINANLFGIALVFL